MLAKLKTYSLLGIDALPVEVEVDVSPAGLPKTILVGLPEAAVKESTHRVERAIGQRGSRAAEPGNDQPCPRRHAQGRRLLRLAHRPGHVAGERADRLRVARRYAIVGELALDGSTRPTKGRLSMAMAAAEQAGLRGLLVPAEAPPRPPSCKRVEVIPVTSLAQAVGFLSGQIAIEPTPSRLDDLFATWPPTRSIFPTFAGRRWPSGR